MLRHIKRLVNPRPTFFDLCVGGFGCILLFKNLSDRAIFIVLYTAFLCALGFISPPKRRFHSFPLGAIILWALLGLFLHHFEIYPISFTSKWPNYYLMAEGFLYILFGSLFIKTVIEHSTNLLYIYVLIPIIFIPWYKGLFYLGSVTPLAAICVSTVIFLFITRRFLIASIISLAGVVGAILNWPWICLKFACRPLIWGQLFKNMFYHAIKREGNTIIDVGIELSPFFQRFIDKYIPEKFQPWLASIYGSGFSEYLGREYTWVDKDKFGWAFRQNDFLALGECLGPIVFVLIIWFVAESLIRIGRRPALIGFLTIVLVCAFQQTMFFPGKAGICLLIGTVCLCQGIKRRD